MTVPDTNSQAQTQEPQKQNDKEYNFAQIRKQLEQERAARMEYEQRLQQLEQERQQKAVPPDDSDDDSDEPYVDRKALRRELGKFSQNIEQKIDQKAEEKARKLVEQERQANYMRSNPDFSDILTSENVQKFAEKYPQIAEPMLDMPDTFSRKRLLYEQMKALNVHKPPEPQGKSDIQEKIDRNRKSPYYQPTGMSAQPYQTTGDFTPAGQKNAYAKMKELISNRRAG
jgi:septal ring factor EnvC (AmiA/AmiB activator)